MYIINSFTKTSYFSTGPRPGPVLGPDRAPTGPRPGHVKSMSWP